MNVKKTTLAAAGADFSTRAQKGNGRNQDEIRSRVFAVVQQLLQRTPLLIWGSGATVPCGLPTMRELGCHVKAQLSLGIDENANFEDELSKFEVEPCLDQIRKSIWKYINKADLKARAKLINGNDAYLKAIASLLTTFCRNHPQTLKIITTNYDRVLENVSAWNGLSFTDGSGLGDLTGFSIDRFSGKENVKIVKVHGSLSWGRFKGGALPRVVNTVVPRLENIIIIPGNNKYREAYNSPYRELIQVSDEYVNEATAFLVIGFGFNDMHITPKVSEKIKNGTPVVIVTMSLSQNTKDLISNAKRYVVLSQDKKHPKMTRIEYKINDSAVADNVMLPGKLWTLTEFMEILV